MNKEDMGWGLAHLRYDLNPSKQLRISTLDGRLLICERYGDNAEVQYTDPCRTDFMPMHIINIRWRDVEDTSEYLEEWVE